MPRSWTLWTDGEVQYLFQCLEQNVDLNVIMGSTSHPNKAIYGRIARKLRRRGFERSQKQVASKVKVMRTAFYRAMHAYGGSHTPPHKPQYFEQMWHLWMLAGSPALDLNAAAARRGRHARVPMRSPPHQKEEPDKKEEMSPPHHPEGDAAEEALPQEPEAAGRERERLLARIAHLETQCKQLEVQHQEALKCIDALEKVVAQLQHDQEQQALCIDHFHVWCSTPH